MERRGKVVWARGKNTRDQLVKDERLEGNILLAPAALRSGKLTGL